MGRILVCKQRGRLARWLECDPCQVQKGTMKETNANIGVRRR